MIDVIAIQPTPITIPAQVVPAHVAIAPKRMAPNGINPLSINAMLNTLPRSWSGTCTCSVIRLIVRYVWLVKPTRNIAIPACKKFWAAINNSKDKPNPIMEQINHLPALLISLPRDSQVAPTSAPIDEIDSSSPNPCGPKFNRSRANSGIIVVYGNPNTMGTIAKMSND